MLTYAVLGLLIWLPLPLGSNRPWSSMLFVLITALLSAAWAWTKLSKPPNKIFKNNALRHAKPLLCLLAASQIWLSIQWLTGISQNHGETLRYLLLGCSYGLLYLLVINLFYTRQRLTLLLSVVVISGAAQAFYGTFMTLSGLEWHFFAAKEHYLGHATGTFVNRNHLAGYLEMTIACGIGLLLALRGGQKFNLRNSIELLMGPKALIRLSLVIMVIAMVMTHSRMGNVAFFSALTIVGGLFIVTNKQHRTRNSLILLSIILIDMLVVSQYFGLENLKDRLVNTRITDQVINGEVIRQDNIVRDDIFVSALPLIEKYAITGAGAGSFESVYQQYPGPDIRLHLDHAHNDYLQFIVEFGLIGLLPLALFVVLSLWHGLQALRFHQSPYRSGIGFASSMGILSLLIHSSTDFNLQIPANAATFTVLCAIAVLAKHHVKTAP
ncbi:MAG: O-antigen ligase family protein [Porticoccaceae bacterium]